VIAAYPRNTLGLVEGEAMCWTNEEKDSFIATVGSLEAVTEVLADRIGDIEKDQLTKDAVQNKANHLYKFAFLVVISLGSAVIGYSAYTIDRTLNKFDTTYERVIRLEEGVMNLERGLMAHDNPTVHVDSRPLVEVLRAETNIRFMELRTDLNEVRKDVQTNSRLLAR